MCCTDAGQYVNDIATNDRHSRRDQHIRPRLIVGANRAEALPDNPLNQDIKSNALKRRHIGDSAADRINSLLSSSANEDDTEQGVDDALNSPSQPRSRSTSDNHQTAHNNDRDNRRDTQYQETDNQRRDDDDTIDGSSPEYTRHHGNLPVEVEERQSVDRVDSLKRDRYSRESVDTQIDHKQSEPRYSSRDKRGGSGEERVSGNNDNVQYKDTASGPVEDGDMEWNVIPHYTVTQSNNDAVLFHQVHSSPFSVSNPLPLSVQCQSLHTTHCLSASPRSNSVSSSVWVKPVNA